MKGATGLLLAIVVCFTCSSFISGQLIPPRKIGMCSWQACVTDKSVCTCMPSIIGVPQVKCRYMQNPKQDVFPQCRDVMLG